MARKMFELNRIINQCVLFTLMRIKLCGGDDGFDEWAMIRCVAIRLDQITDDESLYNHDQLEDFDIDYYIDAYIERMTMEDINNDTRNKDS